MWSNFPSPVTPLVYNWIKNGGPKRLHREQNLIPRLNAIISEIIPFGSVARLMAYLLFQGPDTWGYSPVLPALSFRGIGTRPSVFASYVRADALIRSIAGLHDLIHPGWAPELPENCFGCAHVPDVQEVKDFYASWRMLIQNREDLNDLENIVHRHNGIVTGLHLFGCVLFGGLRNYKGAPPSHADFEASFIINCEKQHFVPTLWSGFLRKSLSLYEKQRRVLTAAAKRFGYIPPSTNDAYCLWDVNARDVQIGPSTLAAALEDCPQLSRWAGFHPNALRALGMTILYESMQFHTHDIERFFGRSLRQLAPLTLHRLEPALDRRSHSRIEGFLHTYLETDHECCHTQSP